MSTQMIKGYKAFNNDLTCRDFLYAFDKTYKIEGAIKMCKRGFHFCYKAPFDVFSYYPVIDKNGEMIRFARVSSPASKVINNDEIIVTSEITIEKELSLSALVEEQIQETFCYSDYTQSEENIDYSQLTATGYGAHLAATGSYSQLTASGNKSQLAATGAYSRLTASGEESHLATTGAYSQLTASGGDSHLAATGAYSRLTASGNGSQLITTGYGANLAAIGAYSRLVATGDGSQVAASGENPHCIVTGQNGSILISGKDGWFKGKNGTYVAIADFDEKGKCNGFVSSCIGEDSLNENTWYTVRNGKFIECEVQ